jgi:RNA polymerase sigma factor (TIGR02999 family)
VSADQATRLLNAMSHGDRTAAEQVLPLIYDELHALAARQLARERDGHTLQPTALVHEAYLRLIDQTRTSWSSRSHFFAVASEMIRRILVDHARAKGRAKRGGDRRPVALRDAAGPADRPEIDLLDLDEALCELGELSERQRRVVEMRYFGGLSIAEAAEVLGIGPTTLKAEWRVARAWLSRRLGAT